MSVRCCRRSSCLSIFPVYPMLRFLRFLLLKSYNRSRKKIHGVEGAVFEGRMMGRPLPQERASPHTGHSSRWYPQALSSISGGNSGSSCFGCPGCPPGFRFPRPPLSRPLGFLGLTISLDGGFEEVDESFSLGQLFLKCFDLLREQLNTSPANQRLGRQRFRSSNISAHISHTHRGE